MTIAEINDLLKDYRPSTKAIEAVRNTRVLFLIGVAGAGKDTLKQKLLLSNSYMPIISYTSRPIRFDDGRLEVEGIDYYFTNLELIKKMLDDYEFIEAKIIHSDTVYGTTLSEFQRISNCGKIAINDINIDGAIDYLNIHSNAKAVFLVPPSYEIWIERLKKRYKTIDQFNEEWPKRLNSAKMEFSRALKDDRLKFVVNDDLDRASSLVYGISNNDDFINYDEEKARSIARDILSKLV